MVNDLKNTQPPEEPPTAAPAGIPSQDPRLKAQEPLTPAERASEANSVVMGGGMAAGAAAGAAGVVKSMQERLQEHPDAGIQEDICSSDACAFATLPASDSIRLDELIVEEEMQWCTMVRCTV